MLNENVIVKVANVLATNSIETQAINASLEIVCESLSFDGGLVYEMDHDNSLHLKEHLVLTKAPIHRRVAMAEIADKYCKDLSTDRMTYVTKKTKSMHSELLVNYHVQALLIISLVDENMSRIGFIIFYSQFEKEDLLEEELSIAKTALYMLAHYIEVRIHQRKLSFSQTSFESILDNTGIDIYVNDFYNHDILYVNKSMAAPYGGIEKFKNKKCYEILFPEQNGPCSFCPQQHIIDEQGNPTKVYTWDYKRAMDGSWFRVFSSAFRWVDGRLGHVVSSADITDNKHNEELINYMANYDSLTKLPNRRKLVTDLEKIISQSIPIKTYILFFDIDGFKAINDNYGHDAGDDFLVQLGDFFTSIDILKDVVYRHGGDEFVAIVDGTMTENQIEELIRTIHTRFTTPWLLKKGEVTCNTSVGIASFPQDGNTVEMLLHKADQAMYKIKKTGGGDMCFNHQLKM